MLHAEKEGITNYSILVSHVLVPPAMEAILDDEFCNIDAFLGAGNVCAIMGTSEYEELTKKHNIPSVYSANDAITSC